MIPWPGRLLEKNLSDCIGNIGARLTCFNSQETDRFFLKNEDPQCWLSSLYRFHIQYAVYEVKRHPRLHNIKKWGIVLFIHLEALLARWAHIDRSVYYRHSLTSINLYADDSLNFLPIYSDVKQHAPHHALILRSLNEKQHAAWLKILRSLGGRAVVFRKIALFDPKKRHTKKQRRNLRKDFELTKTQSYSITTPHTVTTQQMTRIKLLYDRLYLNKYCPLNPDYRDVFFRTVLQDPSFKLMCLEKAGQIEGFILIRHVGNQLSSPCIGYNVDLPRTEGLYRQLVSLAFQYAEDHDCIFNLGAGATEFKQLRGAETTTEYYGVFTRHLPWYRRLSWAVFIFLVNTVWVRIVDRIF